MSSIIKRHVGAVVAVFTLVLAGCAASPNPGAAVSPSASLETVRVGYHANFASASLPAIAENQKLWEKNGLKAETSVFTNGPLEVQALQTGNLDFAYLGEGAMWMPASDQAKIVTIDTLSNAGRVIAQPGIHSIKDLKGKKVAVPAGTTGEMILNLALESAGMSIKDVQKVVMDPSTVVAAFSSGQVDAAGIWYPLIDTIKKQVPNLNELAKPQDFPANAFPTAYISSNDIFKNKPETVKKFVAVMRAAMDFRKAHKDETIKLVAAFLKISVDTVAADSRDSVFSSAELDKLTNDGTVSSWFTGLNKYFVSVGRLPAAVDPKTYYMGDLFVAAGK